MTDIRRLAPGVSVTGAITVEDISTIARQGFRTIINFRADAESLHQVASRDARQVAERLGLAYIHIPTSKHELFTDAVVDTAREAFANSPGPILAHCAGGQRAAIVWAATAARQQPVCQVLDQLKDAGFDLAFLRDDLDAQADRTRWQTGVEPDVKHPCDFSGRSKAAA